MIHNLIGIGLVITIIALIFYLGEVTERCCSADYIVEKERKRIQKEKEKKEKQLLKKEKKLKKVNIRDVIRDLKPNSGGTIIYEDIKFHCRISGIIDIYKKTKHDGWEDTLKCIWPYQKVEDAINTLRGISDKVVFYADDDIKDLAFKDIMRGGKKEMKKENIDITEALKNLSYKDDNMVVFKDILFTFVKEDLKILVSVSNGCIWELKNSFTLCDTIDKLAKYLSGVSRQCNIYATSNIDYMPVSYIMREGQYWEIKHWKYKSCRNCKYWSFYEGCSLYKNKDDYYDIHNNKGYFYRYCCEDWKEDWKHENTKTIDKCDNKDKICKSRAECMREISEQNKFNAEEEFKKICKKERETLLENIHKAIENNAKKGNRKVSISILDYFSKDFRQINFNSVYYDNGKRCFSNRWNYWGKTYLSNEVEPDSYVWKFIDKLDYDTAKRISVKYVYDWIKQTLKDEGFDIEIKETFYIVRW